MAKHESGDLVSAVNAALAYLKLGWEPLRLPQREKKPNAKWKDPVAWDEAAIAAAFAGDANIGIALGSRSSNLVDIDFDCVEAASLAAFVLPELPSFGRVGSPRSHRLVYTKMKKGRHVFQMPPDAAESIGADRAMILEVRGNGHQSMFPPSTHPSGETVTWYDDPATIPTWEAGELIRRCGLLAFLAAVAKYYPRVPGERDEVAMMLAGTLVRCDLSDEDADRLVVAVAEIAGDEEADKRTGKANAARSRIEAGETAWGLPELCARLKMEALQPSLRKWLGLTGGTTASDPRPRILVRPGHQPEELDKAERALHAANLGIYQRGESLVRVVQLPESSGDDGVRRDGGVLVVVDVSQPWLKEKMALSAVWLRPGEDGDIPINPPSVHATALLARVGEWNAPVLRGVVSSPTMRRDGSILQVPGYDPASGLLFQPNGVVFPEVPGDPTREDALEAVRALFAPFREFAFSTPADRSVLLSAIITAVVRRNLRAAPMFAVDAPTAGSGKSLLSETVGIISTGHKPTLISQGKSDEEDEKRLSSILMAGDAMVVIDNCSRPLGGDTLCTMLTQEVMAARVLGRSEVRRMPTNALVMATGNNLEVVGDLGRRTLVCRIDTGSERPDKLEHGFMPTEEAALKRPELVVAALTILRAYDVAGRPMPLTPMGSFEDWNVIREALVWLGEEDPTTTRERVIADDPRKGDLAELLELWDSALGGSPCTLKEISDAFVRDHRGSVGALYSALAERTPKSVFNPRSVGRYLARHKDRVVGGRVLRVVDDPSGVKRYRLDKIGQPPAEDTPF